MASTTRASTSSVFLAAVVALSVYVPFETVAKASLVASSVLFVVDPLPPCSRLIALVSCVLVWKLNAAHRQLAIRRQLEEEQASTTIALVKDGDDDDQQQQEANDDDETREDSDNNYNNNSESKKHQ